jgi:hypothetical protein
MSLNRQLLCAWTECVIAGNVSLHAGIERRRAIASRDGDAACGFEQPVETRAPGAGNCGSSADLRGSGAVADQAIEQPPDPNFTPMAEAAKRLKSAAGNPSPFALFKQGFRQNPVKSAQMGHIRRLSPNRADRQPGFRRLFFAILPQYEGEYGAGGHVIRL